MKYKFIGQPDYRFPHLKTGKVYDLLIREVWYSRGLFIGNPAPKIYTPIVCPYSSWETFYQNWEKVK